MSPHGRVEQASIRGEIVTFAGSDDASIDSDFLYHLLTGDGPKLHVRGMRVVGAHVLGPLDLGGATVTSGLELRNCVLDDLTLNDAHAGRLVFSGSQVKSVAARNCVFDGRVWFDNVQMSGVLDLRDAKVGGSVSLFRAVLKSDGDDALTAQRAHISGDVVLSSATVRGRIRFNEAAVGGSFYCGGGDVEAGAGAALDASRATIAGSAELNRGFTAQRPVLFVRTRIGGTLDCRGGSFTKAESTGDAPTPEALSDIALSIEQATIGGPVLLDRGFKAEGRVRLFATSVTAVQCDGGSFSNPGGVALDAFGIRVTEQVLLRKDFNAEGAVVFRNSTLGGDFQCAGATIDNAAGIAVDLSSSRIGGDAILARDFSAVGSVLFHGADISGALNCKGGSFMKPASTADAATPNPMADVALSAERAKIAGPVFLEGGFRAEGRVRLTDANIGGLQCDSASFLNPAAIAIDAAGVAVKGRVLIRNLVLAEGTITFAGASIEGAFDCSGATITSAATVALNLAGARVDGNLALRRPFVASAAVSLARATVGGTLDCRGGSFKKANASGDAPTPETLWDIALSIEQATIGGPVFLDSGFKADGRVRLFAASVTAVQCDGGSFSNPGGVALDASGIRVTERVLLRKDFNAEGAVVFRNSTVGGDFECAGATIDNAAGIAVDLSYSRIGGGAILTRGFSAVGTVLFHGAEINGALNCTAGSFMKPTSTAEAATPNPMADVALSAEQAKIAGPIFLKSGFRAEGRVRLFAAAALGVDCSEGSFVNAAGIALDLRDMDLSGAFLLRSASVVGVLNLERARVATLVDESSSWPSRVELNGFTYSRLVSNDYGWKSRKELLSRQTTYSSQPYIWLASVYRSGGHERDARKIQIERNKARLRSRTLGRVNPWAQLMRLTVGYGYEPWRAFIPVLLALALVTPAYARGAAHDEFRPTRSSPTSSNVVSSQCTRHYPCLEPIIYALDVIVPLVNLRQRESWYPDSSTRGGSILATLTSVLTIVGWMLTTAVVAGVTSALRRE